MNGVGNMDEGKRKIILPEELQIEMMKFFMKTSIPKIKQEKWEEEQAKQAKKLSSK